jgi:hypothetical protein
MHICLGTLDMIMEVISEELDQGDGSGGYCRVCEVSREKHEGNIAHVVGALESW